MRKWMIGLAAMFACEVVLAVAAEIALWMELHRHPQLKECCRWQDVGDRANEYGR